MNALEDILQSDTSAGQEFWDDCVKTFSSGAGARVLARLCRMVNPLAHTPLSDPVLSAHARGRAEVVSLLWRRSQTVIEPRDAPQP